MRKTTDNHLNRNQTQIKFTHKNYKKEEEQRKTEREMK